MRAMQLFTTIPKYYGDKSSIRPERIERFRTALAETQIDPKHVMAHAPYVLNTATHEEEKSSRARAGLAKELERSTALGIGSLCFHPGRGARRTGRQVRTGDSRSRRRTRRASDRSCARDGTEEHDPRARREHGRRRTHVREDGGRGGRDSPSRAGVAASAHRLRARHVSPLLVRLRSARFGRCRPPHHRRVRVGHGRGAGLLPPERQRRRSRVEPGPAHADRRRAKSASSRFAGSWRIPGRAAFR